MNYAWVALLNVTRAIVAVLTWPRGVVKSEFRRRADRIAEIRGFAFNDGQGGRLMMIGAASNRRLKIDATDYWLMGSDNGSARRNHPDVAAREQQLWFAAARGFDPNTGNQHATSHDGGKTWNVDTFLTTLPRPEYQASPEEVAWHSLRVQELRGQGMPKNERVATMMSEAKNKPWERM